MTETNPNARLEAFSDGVFAIALTLLIIDIKLPPSEHITSTAALWRALQHLAPAVYAFLLSFTIIFISWVNHHGTLKLVQKSSAPFIYANGFMLLTVVFIPFPTALLGEFLWTDFAAPPVVLYNALLVLLAISWILLTGVALRSNLATEEAARSALRTNHRSGYPAVALYTLLAIGALWFPRPAFVITTLTWLFWLALGLRLKHE